MAARGWWDAAWTPNTRRTLLLTAVLMTLVVVVIVVFVVHTTRPPGIALMVRTDQHQIQRVTEEVREEARNWRNRRWPSSPSGAGDDLKNRKRQLIGSSPPTCRAKCDGCAPCQAVHVPIEPGRSSPLEYYPEAWRCKCRNKLFMP